MHSSSKPWPPIPITIVLAVTIPPIPISIASPNYLWDIIAANSGLGSCSSCYLRFRVDDDFDDFCQEMSSQVGKTSRMTPPPLHPSCLFLSAWNVQPFTEHSITTASNYPSTTPHAIAVHLQLLTAAAIPIALPANLRWSECER